MGEFGENESGESGPGENGPGENGPGDNGPGDNGPGETESGEQFGQPDARNLASQQYHQLFADPSLENDWLEAPAVVMTTQVSAGGQGFHGGGQSRGGGGQGESSGYQGESSGYQGESSGYQDQGHQDQGHQDQGHGGREADRVSGVAPGPNDSRQAESRASRMGYGPRLVRR